MSNDAYELTVEITRGTKTDDRDKLKAKVSGDDIGELEERVEQLKHRMESWAEDLRNVQPQVGPSKDEGQRELGGVEALRARERDAPRDPQALRRQNQPRGDALAKRLP